MTVRAVLARLVCVVALISSALVPGSVGAATLAGDERTSVAAYAALPQASAGAGRLFFGVSEGSGTALGKAVGMGATAMRVVVEWGQVEWSRDYHLAAGQGFIEHNERIRQLDARVRAVAGAGLTPVLTVVDAPAWTGDRPRGPLSAATTQLYREFVVNLVNRYKAPPYHVKYWEIWSEPDGGDAGPESVASRRAFGNHPAAFAALLREVGRAIREADPDATVIMGSLAYDWFHNTDSPGFNQGGMFVYSFLDRLIEAGGLNYVDLVAFNAYRAFAPGWEINTPGPERDIAAKARHLRERLAAKGVARPLIAMEGGVWNFGAEKIAFPPDPANPANLRLLAPSDEIQAAGVVQTYARALSADLRGMFWYTLADYDPNKGYGLLGFPPGYVEKPAAHAYQVAARLLRGASYLDPVSGAGVEGYRFRRPDGRRLTVVWAAGLPTDAAVVSLAVRGDQVNVLATAGGHLSTAAVASGVVSVPVTGTPVFVEELVPLAAAPVPSSVPFDLLLPICR